MQNIDEYIPNIPCKTQYISRTRLYTYYELLDIPEEYTLRAYLWNKRISASISPILHTLEVTLRNALNMGVYDHHSIYKDNEMWFLDLIMHHQNAIIGRMIRRDRQKWIDFHTGNRIKYTYYERQIRNLQNNGKNANDIISRLEFGFWTNLLSQKYIKVENNTPREKTLWPEILSDVFPNVDDNIGIEPIFKRFEDIRKFRNRVAHNEPIWKFNTTNDQGETIPVYGLNASLQILRRNYEDIVTALKWISPEIYEEFVNSGLRQDFNMLSTVDGFWACVNTNRVKNTYFLHHFLSTKYYANKDEIDSHSLLLECPQCHYNSMIPNIDFVHHKKCLLCDYNPEAIYVNCTNMVNNVSCNQILVVDDIDISIDCPSCHSHYDKDLVDKMVYDKYAIPEWIITRELSDGCENLQVSCENCNSEAFVYFDHDCIVCPTCRLVTFGIEICNNCYEYSTSHNGVCCNNCEESYHEYINKD